MTTCNSTLWEEKYASGHKEHAPWDVCVAFLFRNAPKGMSRCDINVLEVGCGTASNLFFAARQGFCVSGIDISASAIKTAGECFADADLQADLRVGDFSALPFDDASFHLAMDRGAISYADLHLAERTLQEINRTMKPGGKFFFTPYSDRNTSARSGKNASCDPAAADRRFGGYRAGVTEGGLVGTGQVFVYSLSDVERVLPSKHWDIESVIHVEQMDMTHGLRDVHAWWEVVAVKR